MKTIASAVLSLSLVSASVQAAESPQSVINGYMSAWNAHNITQASHYLAEDVVYYDAATGSPVKGRDKAEKEVIGAFIRAVPNLQWKMTGKPVADKNTIAFQWEFSGKNTGEWAGNPATKNNIRFEGVSFIKINKGEIIWQGDYYDSKKLDAQLNAKK